MIEMLMGGKVSTAFDYIGAYTESQFMSYADLVTALGPEASFTKASTFKYLAFHRGGKIVYVPTAPIGRASYKTIYQKGAVYGSRDNGPAPAFDLTAAGITPTAQDKTITALDGRQYLVRLMKGTPELTYGGLLNNPSFDPPTEWEDFFYNLYSNLPSNLILKNNVANPSDRVVRPSASGNRQWMLTQGLTGTASTPRAIGRGRYDVASSTDYGFAQAVGNDNTYGISALANTNSVWHPVFELMN